MPEATMPVHTGAPNLESFANSGDEEYFDNFADGPQPGDPPQAPTPGVNAPDTSPGDTPMGLGGEHGAISPSEPPTVASDAQAIQPGETRPPATTSDQPSDRPAAGERGVETSPAPPDDPATLEFPPQLLQMAGLTAEQAQQRFSTPRDLFASIQLQAELLGPKGVRPQVPEAPVSVETPAPPAPQDELQQQAIELKAFQIPAGEADMLAPELVSLLDKMNEHYQGQVEMLHSSIRQRDKEFAQRARDDETSRFDNAVQALGSDWQEFFGEGSGKDLQKVMHQDPEAMTHFNHRALLHQAVQSVREANKARGVSMTLDQEIGFALMQQYPNKFAQLLPGNMTPQRPGSTASRPNSRRIPHATQSERTVSAVDEMLRRKGRPGLSMGHKDEEWEGDI